MRVNSGFFNELMKHACLIMCNNSSVKGLTFFISFSCANGDNGTNLIIFNFIIFNIHIRKRSSAQLDPCV